MKVKFITDYDYFQAIFGIVAFVALLSINRNIATVILAVVILLFGIYKAFGRRITFLEDEFISRKLLKTTRISYSEVSVISFTTHLYGRSFLRISAGQRRFFGYIKYSEWIKLKEWFEQNKDVKCTENR